MGKVHHPPSEKDAVLLEKVSKSFGPLNVLSEINFSVKSGESVAILGPSGAGKSTLLHVVGLMEPATSGTVILDGKNTHQMSDKNKAHERLETLGFLFQFHHLLPDFNVLENVLIPARLAGDNLEEASGSARNLLDRLGLSGRLEHKPHQLSGGEQQRTGLARALIRNPKILLCDEPTGNLDQKTAAGVMDLLLEEVGQRQMACVIVTHNEALAKRVDSAYDLSDGALRGAN